MKQNHLQETKAKNNNQGFKKKLKDLESKEVEKATTRIVNFQVLTVCGCGGTYEKYHAEVPISSSIKDGEYVDDFTPDMDNIEEGWV